MKCAQTVASFCLHTMGCQKLIGYHLHSKVWGYMEITPVMAKFPHSLILHYACSFFVKRRIGSYNKSSLLLSGGRGHEWTTDIDTACIMKYRAIRKILP